jgi:SsrA-binding protein
MNLLSNKKALLRFAIEETFSAGLSLTGGEVKSLREKNGSLDGARVVVRGGEAFLVGMTIPSYQAKNTAKEYEADRPRKLLLSKREIAQLSEAESRKGLTVVPIEVYNTKRLLKVRVAIVHGKNKADRREDLKKRDADRENRRTLKDR